MSVEETPLVHAFKLVWNTRDQIWQTMDAQGFEAHERLMSHARQWFIDHPVHVSTFDFPDSDKWHFLWYSIQNGIHDGPLPYITHWMLALFDYLPLQFVPAK